MGWLTRFLAAVAFLAAGVIFSPETFGSLSTGEYSAKLLIFMKLAHLLSFATAWGAALWATFIGGIIMFKYASISNRLLQSISSNWKILISSDFSCLIG